MARRGEKVMRDWRIVLAIGIVLTLIGVVLEVAGA